MQAYYQIWKNGFDSDFTFEMVPTRLCTEDDFGIGRTKITNQKFFTPLKEDVTAFRGIV